jgi:hypothetical protein
MAKPTGSAFRLSKPMAKLCKRISPITFNGENLDLVQGSLQP